MDSDGANLTLISDNASYESAPVYNCFDEKIYYRTNENICRMNLDGSGVEEFFDNNSEIDRLHFDGNGSRLLMGTSNMPQQLILLNIDNLDFEQITFGEDIDDADWSPTYSKVVFDCGTNNSLTHLYKLDISSGELEQIGNFYGHRPTWGFETGK